MGGYWKSTQMSYHTDPYLVNQLQCYIIPYSGVQVRVRNPYPHLDFEKPPYPVPYPHQNLRALSVRTLSVLDKIKFIPYSVRTPYFEKLNWPAPVPVPVPTITFWARIPYPVPVPHGHTWSIIKFKFTLFAKTGLRFLSVCLPSLIALWFLKVGCGEYEIKI